jgi:hypothetical protein
MWRRWRERPASEALRGLIEAIVLTREESPAEAGHYNRRLRIELKGNLAAMLAAVLSTSTILPATFQGQLRRRGGRVIAIVLPNSVTRLRHGRSQITQAVGLRLGLANHRPVSLSGGASRCFRDQSAKSAAWISALM